MLLFSTDLFLTYNSKIAVAFSGGLDSTVLLHYLNMWHKKNPVSKMRAIHINHNLNSQSNKWAMHCKNICMQLHIEYNIVCINVKNNKGQGIEASARQGRYNALISALNCKEYLITAHHLDDQCESLLLALKRGSGPKGLSAMQMINHIGNNKLLRPLLKCSRKTIEEYARLNNLTWIEDNSNLNINYDRNFLRHCIIPKLIHRWPSFTQTSSRSAMLCAEQEALIDEFLIHQLNYLIQSNGSLYFIPLLQMSKIKVYAILRRWIAYLGGIMPSFDMIKHIYDEVIMSKIDAKPCIKISNFEIRRFKKYIYWLPMMVTPTFKNIKITWHDLNKKLTLPCNLGMLQFNQNKNILRKPKLNEIVNIQFSINGYFKIAGRTKLCKITKIWKEYFVPSWERHKIPLIFYNNIFICALGLFITDEGTSSNNEGCQIIWHKDNYTFNNNKLFFN
ncbi:MAG: tRNA lysidine(34) synthetase TilS [Pantoea sp. Brub]|nr:tRNA lysidine(34) synthetase TilS [Pantoea sp. Brub]